MATVGLSEASEPGLSQTGERSGGPLVHSGGDPRRGTSGFDRNIFSDARDENGEHGA